MNEQKSAAFSFENYKITKFSFSENEGDEEAITVKFEPSGEFFKDKSSYVMEFNFFAFVGETEVELLNAKMEATFKFQGEITFEEIPSYFYRNSIAIVFPYLRAFVTTMTAISNVKPLILPVLNLSSLEEILRTSTKSS